MKPKKKSLKYYIIVTIKAEMKLHNIWIDTDRERQVTLVEEKVILVEVKEERNIIETY